jgi:hypothetical protein
MTITNVRLSTKNPPHIRSAKTKIASQNSKIFKMASQNGPLKYSKWPPKMASLKSK